MAQPIRFPAIVKHVIRHSPDVATYILCSDKHLPRFTPGQFIHLTVDEFDLASFWPESRVFSVANAVADRRSIKLTISRQGEYTGRIIDRLRVGDSVWGKGPYGEFAIDSSHGYRHAVLIAGGTGVTPFSAFMDAALTNCRLPLQTVTLYYGAQTEDLLLYRQLCDECVEKVPGFHVRYFSECQPQSKSEKVKHGRLDIADILADQADSSQIAFFLSGPKAMIDAFQNYLKIRGLISEQILIDAWE